jgi:plastocyanin
LLLALALISIIAGIGAAFALAATKSVTLRDNFFSTKTVRIRHGSTVRWHWSRTANLHNVTGITRGARVHSRTGHTVTFSHTFRRKGTYTFICTRHPSQMRMTVRVT